MDLIGKQVQRSEATVLDSHSGPEVDSWRHADLPWGLGGAWTGVMASYPPGSISAAFSAAPA